MARHSAIRNAANRTLWLMPLALLPLCSCQVLQKAGLTGLASEESAATVAPPADAPLTRVSDEAGPPVIVGGGPTAGGTIPPNELRSIPQWHAGSLPPSAWTGQPSPAGRVYHPGGHHVAPGHSCPHCGSGKLPAFQFSEPTPAEAAAMWKPPGIKGPWPTDEYICDGGDMNWDVYVKTDWSVVGLDQEDTIAHYDTLDGRTEVSASNCVCIYSPRFAAVRQVTSPILFEGHERVADVLLPEKVNIHEEERGPRTAMQPEQLVAQLGLDQAQAFRERTKGLLVDQATRLILTQDAFLPYENLMLIQRGQFDASEKARLAERVAAAIVWTENQAVQVLIEGKAAVEQRGLAKPQETVVYELEGKPCLRIAKIADKSEAKPGEIIHFTLRFDNLGDQPVGNVTIIDHLMPRLEYVPGSAESSLKADFQTTEQLPNETLVLRWEIVDPVPVNGGGIVRFQARVR